MDKEIFRVQLFLPAQAASETEAVISKWKVRQGDDFSKGQVLAEVESAKSIFDFEAPCAGKAIALLHGDGATVSYDKPVMEIETTDSAMRSDIPPAAAQGAETMEIRTSTDKPRNLLDRISHIGKRSILEKVSILGVGAFVPERVVTNRELLKDFPDTTEDYIFGVTGIRERRWAKPEEKPSDLAYRAALEAIKDSGIDPKEIDGIIVSTTTPNVIMPATACILQDMLGLRGIPAFDLNAACSGWLYCITVAKGLIYADIAKNVLVVAVDMQSRLLDKSDKSTYFLFGDGAGATIVSGNKPGHTIRESILIADPKGIKMARREYPGYYLPESGDNVDPWVRVDGHALFRFATESFFKLVVDTIEKSQWHANEVRWVIPHQANGRILKAAAQKSGVPFERWYLNIDHVGNTSSASIPLALTEVKRGIQTGDKIIFCSVGAGITAAAISVEW